MTTTITYKLSPARRPTLDDLHGGLVADDSTYPPNAGDPHASAMNQSDLLVIAAHAVLPVFRLYVTVPSGTPTATAIKTLRDDLVIGDFTITDNGAGDTSITHTGGKLPSDSFPAKAYATGNAGDCTVNVESIANGWRIRARVAGTLTDTPFVLEASGL